MSAYILTYPEAWTLATLLHLPIQPGSALAGWLNACPEPPANGMTVEAVHSLAVKGYYTSGQSDAHIPTGLLSALALVSVNAAELMAVLRTGRQAALARFAQAGEAVVQYGADEQNLYLHPVDQMSDLTTKILPAWFQVQCDEGVWADLPLGAFLLFKHACTLADWAAARSGFFEERFTRAELLDSFLHNTAWLDLFSDIGMKGVQTVDKLPLADDLSQLVARGYLLLKEGDNLEIGEAGKPLVAVFSDPALCTLTLSMLTWEDSQMESGAFLYGAGRLFLLNFTTGRVSIQQCGDVNSGLAWIKTLLTKGSRARYAQYQIPAVPSQRPGKPAPVTLPQPPAPVRPAPARPVSPPPASRPAPLGWYYLNQGKQAGPVEESVLRNWLAQRQMSPDTLVWNSTLPGWVKASQSGLLSPPARFCPRCGAMNAPGATSCAQCKTKL